MMSVESPALRADELKYLIKVHLNDGLNLFAILALRFEVKKKIFFCFTKSLLLKSFDFNFFFSF